MIQSSHSGVEFDFDNGSRRYFADRTETSREQFEQDLVALIEKVDAAIAAADAVTAHLVPQVEGRLTGMAKSCATGGPAMTTSAPKPAMLEAWRAADY